jgi:hypothetical protein
LINTPVETPFLTLRTDPLFCRLPRVNNNNDCQVACVVIFFFLLSGFYVFYVPVFLETWQAAVAGGLYSLTIFITAVLFLWTRCAPLPLGPSTPLPPPAVLIQQPFSAF